MTTVRMQTGLTARTFLLGNGTVDDVSALRHALSDHDILSQSGGDLARLVPEARQAADDALASVTAGLLDIDLGDVLIYGWRMHDRLAKAARQTMRAPGRQEVVQLASHQLTWTKNPTIDLLVDGVRVHTFRFQLTIVFGVDVAAAVVQEGKLTALKAGDGSISATLTLEMPGGDIDLLQQERRINLHRIIKLGSGISLLPAEPDSLEPELVTMAGEPSATLKPDTGPAGGAAVKGYVVVFEGDDQSGYSAYSPDLPGVVAAGDSRQDAERLMLKAMAAHIGILRRDGRPVPEPSEATSVAILDPAAA